MQHKTFSLYQLYKISFILFFLIPLLSIVIKSLNGVFEESIGEIWFFGLLLIIITIIYLLPNINKQLKERIMFLCVSITVFYFGLGSLGFQTDYFIVDFSDKQLADKIPYIFMFIILFIQFISLSIYGYLKHNNDFQVIDHNHQYVIIKGLHVMMGIMVFLSYTLSIIMKLIFDVSNIYIHFELGILLGYVFLYICLLIIAKIEFKQTLKNARINALFFVPILSIGLGLGILLFPEDFIHFKMTTVICGFINLIIYIFNFILIKSKKA